MSILAAFSGPMQSSDDFEVISLCVEGFKLPFELSVFSTWNWHGMRL
jgi:hypothetical protein